ncbi:hypothetical protein Sjap_002163 [Stephania japonica]|uniref:Angiotensin-converting enzyme 2 n=1 Tax=Stephania japonica TaxID=461633 RepID=A0AAP0KMY9_9MAGN
MSSGEVRRVSRQDIQLVQNLIERCLQLYMNQKEVVDTLLVQAKIEPGFTELVWQKLEEENQEFFKAYRIRLMAKDQIIVFNKLLEKQVQLMRKIFPAGVAPVSVSNGSHTSTLHQTSPCYVTERKVTPLRPDGMHHNLGPSNPFMSDGTSVPGSIHSDDTLAHSKRMHVSPDMIPTQNSDMAMIQGINGMVIKSESGYSSNANYAFGIDGSAPEMRSTLGDPSVATFSSVESNSEALNEPLLDTDTSAYGFLGQIPRNFSLSDLTADFSQSSDILESYSRSPFLATDGDNYLDAVGKDCQEENRRLDTISEGLSYEEFGAD